MVSNVAWFQRRRNYQLIKIFLGILLRSNLLLEFCCGWFCTLLLFLSSLHSDSIPSSLSLSHPLSEKLLRSLAFPLPPSSLDLPPSPSAPPFSPFHARPRTFPASLLTNFFAVVDLSLSGGCALGSSRKNRILCILDQILKFWHF